MESDDTWITTAFLIDTTFYGFVHYSSVKHVYLGWVVQWGLGVGLYAAADDSLARAGQAKSELRNVSVRFYG